MKIVIIAGGAPPSHQLLSTKLTKDTIIIAADSGANVLCKYDITPSYLIGDLDSIDKKALDFCISNNVKIEKHHFEKNLNDTELSLNKALSLNPTEIVFFGVLGSRIDHVLGSFGLLDKCTEQAISASIFDEQQQVLLLTKNTKLYGNQKQIFSLQAYTKDVEGLTISGSKYTVDNYRLKAGDSRTISNEFLHQNQPVTIEFLSGKLLVIIQRK